MHIAQAREVVPLLSGSARCARHTSSRVAVLGALGKESSDSALGGSSGGIMASNGCWIGRV